jgi:transposase
VLLVQDARGVRGKAFRVNVGRQEFEALDAQLGTSLPTLTADQILVGIEFAGHHGFTLAQFLNDRGYRVVNVLPSVTKRSKEIEDNSPLKTDAKDAAVIARLTSEGKFVDFPFLDPTHASLRGLTMNHHRLTGERTRLKNRLQGLLDVAWPEFTTSFVTVLSPTPRAILARWPVPQDLVLASPRMVRKVAKDASRNHVKAEAVNQLLASAKTTLALRTGVDERRLEMFQIMARLDMIERQLETVAHKLDEVVAGCPAARALTTVPEVGTVCAATIVSELGNPHDFESPRQVLKLAGMNLVERSSGMLRGRRFQSKRGRSLLRRQLFLLAGRWVREDRGFARPFYEAYVERNGGLRIKAVCAVARKLVPMLLAIMHSGEDFDIARWQRARHDVNGSPYRR